MIVIVALSLIISLVLLLLLLAAAKLLLPLSPPAAVLSVAMASVVIIDAHAMMMVMVIIVMRCRVMLDVELGRKGKGGSRKREERQGGKHMCNLGACACAYIRMAALISRHQITTRCHLAHNGLHPISLQTRRRHMRRVTVCDVRGA